MNDDPCSPPKKKKEGLFFTFKEKERFETTSVQEFECVSKKFVPKNSTASLNWAFRIFSDWLDHCKQVGDRNYEKEDLWLCRDPEYLSTILSLFCVEVK